MTAPGADAERLARVALSAVGEPGDPRMARLVAQLGAGEVYQRLREEADVQDLHTDLGARMAELQPARLLGQAERQGIRFVVPGDPEWPPKLVDLDAVEPLNGMSGAPVGLWVRGPGRLDELTAGAAAIVGSRSATTYGTAVAADLAAHLAGHGTTVVSGAAYGIDQAAHRGALGASGPTMAVLACGVDRAYPAAHRALLDHLAASSAVVSELPPGCAPTRLRFLSRNRLIAALTSGTVVVEAAVRSGALNTANWAHRLHRTVMGVPGPVTSAPSEGVHELVRAGTAVLVTRGDHVAELLAPAGERLLPAAVRTPPAPRDRLEPVDRRVLEAVPVVRPAPTTRLARTAGLSTDVVADGLVRLRDGGWVVEEGGGWRLARPRRQHRAT